MKKMIAATMTALIMSLACLTGCGQSESVSVGGTKLAAGGTLVLKVNPEIAVEYDDAGVVTQVSARNNDAIAIIESCEGLIGLQARQAVVELVSAIGQAGYFVEEAEGSPRQITLEIEAGSELPHGEFLDEVVSDIRECVNTNTWQTALNVENESDYGLTNYTDTDYGPGNDGVTDYAAPTPASSSGSTAGYADTDYGPNNDGVTDYADTDYGPNNDGVTDYADTDYGPNNDGVTDYADTDYGPNNDGVTDYADTDYGPNNDGVTDYSDTNYGTDDDGASSYGGSDYGSDHDDDDDDDD